jgi:DNA invertase Pin-like site-specific DNA recombinase
VTLLSGAFARYERAMIVAKLRGARLRMRAKTGRCEGRKPYGARPGEAKVIARMKELRKQGCSLSKIAEAINREARPVSGDVCNETRAGNRPAPPLHNGPNVCRRQAALA